MANRHRVEQPFKFFGWDEKDPIGKYKQPISEAVTNETVGSGYPQEGIDNDDITVFNRITPGTKKKVRMEMKGAGAAERGKKFMVDERHRDVGSRQKAMGRGKF